MFPIETELHEKRELVERAMKLSRALRESLAFELLETLDEPPEDPELVRNEWRQELAKRIEEIESGSVELYDAREALARIRSKLQRAREP